MEGETSSFWTIRRKLFVGFGAVVSLTIIVGGVGFLSLNMVSETVNNAMVNNTRIATLSTLIETDLLEARRKEKDYYLRYKSIGLAEARRKYVAEVSVHIDAIRKHVSEAVEVERANGDLEDVDLFGQVSAFIDVYESNFLRSVALVEQRGHVDTGLEGQFRAKVHAVEELITDLGRDELIVLLLTLRRHEKDYLLRGGQKYIDRVELAIADFQEAVFAAPSDLLSEDLKAEINFVLLDDYLVLFQQLADTGRELELSIGKLRETVEKIEPIIKELNRKTSNDFRAAVAEVKHRAATASLVQIGIVTIAAVLGVFVAYFLARNISGRVGRLNRSAAAIAQGNFDVALPPGGGDEIGQLTHSFGHMAGQLQQTMAGLEQRIAERTDELQLSLSRLEIAMKMATPITQIWGETLMIPLVGVMDAERTERIMTSALDRISETGAQVLILDISGVAVVDTAVANDLIRITKATRLMGCESIISGLSPDIAETIIQLGIDIRMVKTTATLQNALQRALQRTSAGA